MKTPKRNSINAFDITFRELSGRFLKKTKMRYRLAMMMMTKKPILMIDEECISQKVLEVLYRSLQNVIPNR